MVKKDLKKNYAGYNIEVVISNILCNRNELINSILYDMKLTKNDIIIIDDQYIKGLEVKEEMKMYEDVLVDIGDIIENKDKLIYDKKIPIVYFINRIPKDVFEFICAKFNNSEKIVIVGDPMLNSPELNNYFMNLLSKYNYQYELNVSRKLDRDICSLLNKVIAKKFKLISITTIISNYKNLKFSESEYVNLNDPNNYDCDFMVVPKHLYTELNAEYRKSKGINNTYLNPNDKVLVELDFILKTNNRNYRIPRGSILSIKGRIDTTGDFSTKIDKVKCDIIIPESISYKKYILEDIELNINSTFFSLHFNDDLEGYPTLNDFYEFNINDMYMNHSIFNNEFNNVVLTSPYHIINSDMCKNIMGDNVTVYYQERLLDTDNASKEPLYKYLLSIRNKAMIYYGFSFKNFLKNIISKFF